MINKVDKNEKNQKYKTPQQQIELLKSRELKFKNEEKAKNILKKINYYNLINPYGKPFYKEKDLYIEGAKFEQIYSFYKFDKNISFLFLSYILDIESSFKTAISHVVSSKGEDGHKQESYLNTSIFENEEDKTPEEKLNDEELIENLKSIIEESNKLYIKHNKKRYGNVPFWVLSNEMDFGQTIYYYEKLPEKDRNKVSLIMRDKNKEVKLTLTQFKSAMYMLKDLRNLIAHNEVFYWFEPTNRGRARWYGFSDYKGVKSQKSSIAVVMLIFNMYLSSEDWCEFYTNFEKHLEKLSVKIPDNIFQNILKSMGFYKILNKKYEQEIISIEEIRSFFNQKL